MNPMFSDTSTRFDLSLPEWAVDALNDLPRILPTLEERMAAVIDFSRRNFVNKTGGPFAAGVFERDSGRLVAVSYTHLRAHETVLDIVCRLLLEKNTQHIITLDEYICNSTT